MELGMFVTDPTQKAQHMMWGTTRTLISNAITGHTTGFTLPLYLLGVGFCAALDPNPHQLPANHQDVLAVGRPDVPRTRVAMKLGYPHTVYVVVREGIKVTLLSPTIIVVFGRPRWGSLRQISGIKIKGNPSHIKTRWVFFPRWGDY
jgi:large subunit ribosomal protein L6